MDETLQSFLWDDPVAHKFKADYEEQFQPLKEQLLPAMEKYESYLKDLAGLSDVYTENSSPSLSAFKAAAAAGIVGVAGAGAAAGTGITGNEAAFTRNTASESDRLFRTVKPENSDFENISKTGNAFSDIATSRGINSSTFVKGQYNYDGTDFSSIFQGIDLNPSTWDTKTKEEKWRALQDLEKAIARKEGRNPARIFIEGEESRKYPAEKTELSEFDSYGTYYKEFGKDGYSGKIVLNKYFFENKEQLEAAIDSRHNVATNRYLEFKQMYPPQNNEEDQEISRWVTQEKDYKDPENLRKMDFSIYQAVSTTAHEGRHDYQYEEFVRYVKNPQSTTKHNPETLAKMGTELVFPEKYYARREKRNDLKCFTIRDNNGMEIGERDIPICDYNNYAWDNEVEKDARPFGDWFRDLYKDHCKKTYK
jgi:hypothetical protein